MKEQRDEDLRMLNELLGSGVLGADGLRDAEVEAFASMRFDLKAYQSTSVAGRPGFYKLTDKQRAWVVAVHERVTGGGYENLVSSGKVPRGAEVQLMVGPLPKRPPQLPARPERRGPERQTQEHRPFRYEGLDEREDE
jgi:hypothetical protein